MSGIPVVKSNSDRLYREMEMTMNNAAFFTVVSSPLNYFEEFLDCYGQDDLLWSLDQYRFI